MLAYTGPPAALGPAETFFRGLRDTPRAGAKVAAMLFSRQFCWVAENAGARVETLKMVRVFFIGVYVLHVCLFLLFRGQV